MSDPNATTSSGGSLPGFRIGGRKGGPVRFRLSEVERLLESLRPTSSK
jgi:hypothetical protein